MPSTANVATLQKAPRAMPKLKPSDIAKAYVEPKILAASSSSATILPATIFLEVVHNHRYEMPQLHILLLPANRVTPSRYTLLDNIPEEHLEQAKAALLAYMHLSGDTVHYIEAGRNSIGFVKAYLGVER